MAYFSAVPDSRSSPRNFAAYWMITRSVPSARIRLHAAR